MDISKIASFITLEPSQLFRAERCVEQGLKMYNSDEELTEAYLKEHLHGVTLNYAMHVLDESSTSYMDVAIHNQGGKFSAPTAGVYGVSSRPEVKQKIKDKVLKRNELEKKQKSMKKEEVELDELYKGKHGQTEKQYQDSRSDAGKMISGDSKGSGANYSYRAKNTGSNPAGGSKKPQGQARMGSKDRAYLKMQKANLRKEDASMSPQETALQKKRLMVDLAIAKRRKQDLSKKTDTPTKVMGEDSDPCWDTHKQVGMKKKGNRMVPNCVPKGVKEETEDSLKDRRMERGGVDGNNRYDKAPSNKPNTFGKKKPYDGMSALEKVKASIRAKHGQGAIMDTKKK